MQVVYERCCGLDVHKKVVVACLIVLAANGQRHKEIRTFGTMTHDLLALLDWLIFPRFGGSASSSVQENVI